MPHGFSVDRVGAEEVPNMFAPDLFTELRIEVDLSVPTIYSPGPGPHGVRACLPASRDNLDALQAAISTGIRTSGLRGARLQEWHVTPEEAPAPYEPDGTPNGTPAEWAVEAVIEAL